MILFENMCIQSRIYLIAHPCGMMVPFFLFKYSKNGIFGQFKSQPNQAITLTFGLFYTTIKPSLKRLRKTIQFLTSTEHVMTADGISRQQIPTLGALAYVSAKQNLDLFRRRLAA